MELDARTPAQKQSYWIAVDGQSSFSQKLLAELQVEPLEPQFRITPYNIKESQPQATCYPDVIISTHCNELLVAIQKATDQTKFIVLLDKPKVHLQQTYGSFKNVSLIVGKVRSSGRILELLGQALNLEVRISERVPFVTSARLVIHGESIRAQTINLSRSGALLHALDVTRHLTVGVSCTITIYAMLDASQETLALDGVVSRISDENQVAVRFASPSEATQETIAEIIETQQRRRSMRDQRRQTLQVSALQLPERTAKRVPVRNQKLKARVNQTGDTQRWYFRVENISATGVLIMPNKVEPPPLPLGTHLELLILSKRSSVKCAGEVVRHGETPGSMGVRFVPSDEIQQFLTLEQTQKPKKPLKKTASKPSLNTVSE